MVLAASEIYKKYQSCPENDRQFSIALIAQSIIEAEPEDTAALFSLISRLAQGGSAFALCIYGMLFEHGVGIKCNQAAARTCYRNSALGGCTRGMLQLHRHIMDVGKSDPQEEEEAVFWLDLAVSRGDWSAFAAQSVSTHDNSVLAGLCSKTRDNAMRGEQRAQFVLGMYHFNKRNESDMSTVNHHALSVMWWSLAARCLGSRKSGYTADAGEFLALAQECDTAHKNYGIGMRMADEYLASPRPWFVTVEVLDRQVLVEPLSGVLFSPGMACV
jgi:TPR repeat protein